MRLYWCQNHIQESPCANEHLHWIWRTSVDETRSEALNNYTCVTVDLQTKLPVYASLSLKREFILMYGCCTGLKLALLRSMFRKLMRDQSASANLSESEIDERV